MNGRILSTASAWTTDSSTTTQNPPGRDGVGGSKHMKTFFFFRQKRFRLSCSAFIESFGLELKAEAAHSQNQAVMRETGSR